MKGRIDTVADDFWTERLPFFTVQFPTYYRKPQRVHGRFHTSEETFESLRHEIIPISAKHGKRTYVLKSDGCEPPGRATRCENP